jgi:hypothetical protein
VLDDATTEPLAPAPSPTAAARNQRLLIASQRVAVLEAAIDRVERRLVQPAPFDQNEAYGEAHGRVSSRRVAERFAPSGMAANLARGSG